MSYIKAILNHKIVEISNYNIYPNKNNRYTVYFQYIKTPMLIPKAEYELGVFIKSLNLDSSTQEKLVDHIEKYGTEEYNAGSFDGSYNG